MKEVAMKSLALPSIRIQLAALFVLLVTVTIGAFGVYGHIRLSNELEERFAEQQKVAVLRLQTALPMVLWNYDKAQMDRILSAELKPVDVLSVEVSDSKSIVVANASRMEPSSRQSLSSRGDGTVLVESDIYLDATDLPAGAGVKEGVSKVGHVSITYTRAYINKALRRAMQTRLLEILLLDGLLVVALTFSLNVVFKPIANLRDALFNLAAQEGDEAKELPDSRQKEFSEVIQAFNMTQRRLHQVIVRHALSEEAARRSASQMEVAYQDLKAAQESLVQSEKLASLGGLVAGVAHEINTPIGIVITGASALEVATGEIQKSLVDGSLRKSYVAAYLQSAEQGVRLILANAERAATLIQSFKQVAVDQTSDQRRSFDLKTYLNELVTSLQPTLRKAQVSVVLSCPDGVTVDSYPGLIAQVLTNLTMNSITHGFSEGVPGQIRIDAHSEENMIFVAFEDDGRGIPAEHLGKIFDPFFTTRRGQGGTGLGLNIVFNIVTKQLKGTINVQSTHQKGTIFAIAFPRFALT